MTELTRKNASANNGGELTDGNQTIAGDKTFTGNISASNLLTLAEGEYTPTLTNVANTSALSVDTAKYFQVGNSVFVSGVIQLTNTGTGGKRFRVSLPVAANFTNIYDVQGSANMTDTALAGIAGSGVVLAYTTNNELEVYIETADTNTRKVMFSATYRV